MVQSKKRLVIKIGSSTLVDEDCHINERWLSSLAASVCSLRTQGWQVVIVSSGAIACGMRTLGFSKRPNDVLVSQAAAAVGQNAFCAAWSRAFAAHDVVVGSVLLTRRDTADRSSYLHARDTLNKLLDLGVVPIVNENDTISVEQINFGDNDTLSALVSCVIEAKKCIILSDIEGLYDKNPSEHSNAHLVPRVDAITPEVMACASSKQTKLGSGGMITKLNAARVLMAAGIELVVAHGKYASEALSGQGVGTLFVPHNKAHAITPKKLWIALGSVSKGELVVDAGASRALLSCGSSLLSVGITKVQGTFDAGDVVDVLDSDGCVIARGRSDFSSDEISLACGRTSEELSRNRLLEPLSQRPIIHRDELMVF